MKKLGNREMERKQDELYLGMANDYFPKCQIKPTRKKIIMPTPVTDSKDKREIRLISDFESRNE